MFLRLATGLNPEFTIWVCFCPQKNLLSMGVGGSPGLVVMGDNSCLRGRGFDSWCCILDGHDIFHIDLL